MRAYHSAIASERAVYARAHAKVRARSAPLHSFFCRCHACPVRCDPYYRACVHKPLLRGVSLVYSIVGVGE